MGSGCWSCGRLIIFNTIDPQFKSSHWQKKFSSNCIKKKNKVKETGNGPFKKTLMVII